nr:hypothetical protein [uncultured Psychroserpens sp.]
MKKLIIYGFETKEQFRIQFTNFLKKYGGFGLKDSKNLLDRMLDGIPIEFEIPEHHIIEVSEILDKLNMKYIIS